MNNPTKQQFAAEYACGCFNELYPVGQKVVLTKDDGSTLETTTRSEAYVSDAGYPVIFLNGVRGYYILQRVRAI